MKNIKYWLLVCILGLGIFFLGLDNCGNTAKYNQLKGEYETYSTISKIIVKQSFKAIDKQKDEIGILSEKLTYLHGIIEVKDRDLAEKEDEIGELKRDFANLEECQGQYDKLVEAFSLAKGIIKKLGKPIEYYDEHGNRKFRYPEGTVTFSLNEKYEAQVVISLEWEKMYNSVQPLIDIHIKQVKELEKINRRLKFTSKLKTGIVVVGIGVVLYSLLRK